MPCLNPFLIVLLCFAIPLQGQASLIVSENDCSRVSVEYSSLYAAVDHHCEQADKQQLSGKQHCKVGKLQHNIGLTLSSPKIQLSTDLRRENQPIGHALLPSIRPAETWRPPNSPSI